MADPENPPGGGTSGRTKAYFLAKNSTVDELIVGGEKSVFKDQGHNDPVDLTEDEVKDARAMGVSLSEAKT